MKLNKIVFVLSAVAALLSACNQDVMGPLYEGAQGDDDVHIVPMLDVTKIRLDGIAVFRIIFHQVRYFQQASFGSLHRLYSCIVIGVNHLSQSIYDGIHFTILTQACSSPGIHTRDVDDGLLRAVQHFMKHIRVFPLIELVAYLQVLQILIAVELLIIVVGHGMKPRFIFRSQHWNTIATEVTARHGQDMCIRVRHQSAHHIAQSAFRIGTGMMKFIDAHQCIVEFLVSKFLEGIAKSGVCTHQCLGRSGWQKKLLEFLHLPSFTTAFLTSAEVEVRSHRPVAEEAELLQLRILERTSDALFGHCYDGFADALLRHFIESHEHHGTALP